MVKICDVCDAEVPEGEGATVFVTGLETFACDKCRGAAERIAYTVTVTVTYRRRIEAESQQEACEELLADYCDEDIADTSAEAMQPPGAF